MSKYVVHLLQPLDMPARTVAFHAAPHLRVEADRLEQVLARGPGVVTQPTSRTEAQRVADILAAAGAPAQVRPAAPNVDVFPAPPGVASGVGSSAGASDFSNLPNRREPTRRLSLRGKLLLLTLLPVLLLSGATLYVGFGAVRELSTTLSASWADALALTLASDISATVAQNGLAVGETFDEDVARYVTERLRLNQAGLRDVVGVAVTDAAGRPLVLSWSPERPNPPPDVLRAVATATLRASDFGENAAAFSATLNARTRRFGDGFVTGPGSGSDGSAGNLNGVLLVGAPLLSDVGTVQVALDADASSLTAGFARPLLLVVLGVLLLATLSVILFASRLTRRLRVLTTAANHLSLGELDEPVALRGNDEMRDLAEALEHMRVALRAAVSQMRRREGRGR